MFSVRPRLVLGSLLAVPGLTLAAAAPADADVYPAGTFCSFPVDVSGVGGNTRTLTFTDAAGNPVRVFQLGRGPSLTFTNVGTGDSIQLRSNGFTQKTTVNPDGTQTVVSTGHNVLVLFPSDVPPGPSTTLVVGRFVYDVDATGVFTLRELSGRTTNICAEIA